MTEELLGRILSVSLVPSQYVPLIPCFTGKALVVDVNSSPPGRPELRTGTTVIVVESVDMSRTVLFPRPDVTTVAGGLRFVMVFHDALIPGILSSGEAHYTYIV